MSAPQVTLPSGASPINAAAASARRLTGGSRWPFRWVALALSVTAFGAGLPTPIYSIYEQEFHFSAPVLGVVFGAYTAGVFLTMFVVAPLSDAWGRKPVLYSGMALTALSGVVFLLASGIPLLGFARVVSGLAVGATTSTATAAMAGLEPRGDQHHVARVAVAANFGGVASGVLLSGLWVEYGPDPTHLVYLVLVAAGFLGAVGVAASPETVAVTDRHRRLSVGRLRIPPEERVSFWVSAGALAACYSIYGLFGALAPSFLRVGLHVENYAEAAGFVSVMFGMAALVQLGLGEVRDRRALLIGLPVLVLGIAVFVLSLPLGSVPLLVAGAAVVGTGVGFAYMGSVTLIDRISPGAIRSEILSAFYLTGYLALAVPTIGVAVALDEIGLDGAGLAFGAVLGAVVLVLFFVLRRTPTPPGGEGRPRPSD